jgi:hypothetical protein
MSDNLHSALSDTSDKEMPPAMLKVSADGYIRLTFADLQIVRLEHLMSGLDDNDAAGMSDSATRAAITGYTEWLSTVTPQISIGWDWEMEFVCGAVCLRRQGSPRSNVMLQGGDKNDLSHEKSMLLQELHIDEMNWQSIVMEQIKLRYR